MKIQNEKFDSPKFDSSKLDPRILDSLKNDSPNIGGAKIGAPDFDGQVHANNDWHHSVERWQALERLSGVGPALPPTRGSKIGRDALVFFGGGVACIAIVIGSQLGSYYYNSNMPALMQSPLVASTRAALTRMTVHAEKSLLTGIVDPDTLTASLYWNIDLKNNSGVAQEAQAELTLPPGAVVSRATLWVNGVPQEAAFSTTGQVTNAYNWVTVSHRDPLLVTYKNDHTVLIKASPVPANGEVMKIRLGITAPLALGADGQGVLTVPELKEANFALADKNQIHIESKRRLQFSDKSAQQEHSLAGKYLLTADLPASDLAKLKIACSDVAGSGNFAVRATHSLPGTYIYSRLPSDEDAEYTNLERKQGVPDGRVVLSEQAAHRVSTLWAAREIARLVSENRQSEAQDLASVYRIVSPVSGAVVLEMDSDYTRNGLNRDQYMVSVPGQKPIAGKYPQPVTTPGNVNPMFINGNMVSNGLPMLQGATNGTIIPNGPGTAAVNWMVASSRDANLFDGGASQGADATIVSGVNTAGTVRVNNLASLEAVLNIFAKACDVGFIIAALYFALSALRKMKSSGFKAGIRDLLIASSLAFCGTLWLFALPLLAIYKLIQYTGSKLMPVRNLPGGAGV